MQKPLAECGQHEKLSIHVGQNFLEGMIVFTTTNNHIFSNSQKKRIWHLFTFSYHFNLFQTIASNRFVKRSNYVYILLDEKGKKYSSQEIDIEEYKPTHRLGLNS